MAVENLYGSLVMTPLMAAVQNLPGVDLNGGRVRAVVETVEVSAAASATSDYLMARLPASVVLLPQSKLYIDDLASAGSPTLDIGIFNRPNRSDITDNDDALNDGIDAANAGSHDVIKVISDVGKKLWEHAGESSDPKAQVDIKITLKDAAANDGGTMTLVLFYIED